MNVHSFDSGCLQFMDSRTHTVPISTLVLDEGRDSGRPSTQTDPSTGPLVGPEGGQRDRDGSRPGGRERDRGVEETGSSTDKTVERLDEEVFETTSIPTEVTNRVSYVSATVKPPGPSRSGYRLSAVCHRQTPLSPDKWVPFRVRLRRQRREVMTG